VAKLSSRESSWQHPTLEEGRKERRKGGGGWITFITSTFITGGVALVGTEIGLRRPDVESFPQHRVGPQLQHAPAAPTSSDKEAKMRDTEAEDKSSNSGMKPSKQLWGWNCCGGGRTDQPQIDFF
jgi:hypothetical protein